MQEREKNGFRGLSIDSALEIFDHKKMHKAKCKGSPDYRTFKEQVKKLRMAKLPFRVTEIVNQSLKKGGFDQIPQSILQGPLKGFVNFSIDRKTLAAQLEQTLVARSHSHDQALQIAERIHWLHGTNSSLLKGAGPCDSCDLGVKCISKHVYSVPESKLQGQNNTQKNRTNRRVRPLS